MLLSLLFAHLWLVGLTIHTLIAHAHTLFRCAHDNNPVCGAYFMYFVATLNYCAQYTMLTTLS